MYAFADCKSLKQNLILPDGLVNITLAAFEGLHQSAKSGDSGKVSLGFPNDNTLGAYDMFPGQSEKPCCMCRKAQTESDG